jgi:hypothetical protein
VCRSQEYGRHGHCCCIPPPNRHGFWPSVLAAEEEVRELEEYKEALEKELEKVKKRLEALNKAE